MRYIKYILLGFVFGLAYMLSLFIYPLAYVLRKPTRKYKFYPLWIFLNDSEADGISDDYGALWWRTEKNIKLKDANWFERFWISYRWSALRNSHWNLKMWLAPKKGAAENVKIHFDTTSVGGTTFCNYKIKGKQFCTYTIRGSKYFRYSHSKVLFNKVLWNVQLGASQVRYIYKNRIKWL